MTKHEDPSSDRATVEQGAGAAPGGNPRVAGARRLRASTRSVGVLLVCLGLLPAIQSACSSDGPGGGSADASVGDTTASDTSTPPPGTDAASDTGASPSDAAPPMDAPIPDADASADAGPGDAETDAGLADAEAGAADADADSGARDAGTDAADSAAPPPLGVVTIDTGVADYDASESHVIYRKGTEVFYCESRTCVTPHRIQTSTIWYTYFVATTTKFYIFREQAAGQTTLHSFLPTRFPAATTNEHPIGWTGGIHVTGFEARGAQIRVDYRLIPLLGPSSSTFRTTTITTDHVPRVGTTHRNFGAQATLGAGALAPTVTGANLPPLATPATHIGTSARGATVPHPAVVILRDGNLEACPTAGDCATWLNLGPLGDTFNLDDTNLYVGGPTGPGKCALSEIGTLGTCTLTPLVVGDPIASPMILTPSLVWFLTGGALKSVTK